MTTVQEDLEARESLEWIAAMWPELRARLRREGSNPLTGRVSGSESTPLVIDVAVSDLMREIEDEARSLAHVLCDETVDADGQPWAPRTSAMPDLLREVASHYGHFTTGDERTALAFCDWAHEYREKVRRAIERPAPPSYMGDCPRTIEQPLTWDGEQYIAGDPCPGSLYLRPGRATMRCPACHGETTLDDQREHIRVALESRLMTAPEIRASLVVLGAPVPHSTIRTWIERGRLPEVYPGERLYRLADAIDLASRRLARAG